ncbi:MAG: flagellar export protein FliJ [Thermotoga sp.]|nr:flagellar export protein FliJ [Thermotogota bacterium]RKX56096.1 MAG: flagellar export protein FliJ [Thermotoga sp.]
MKRFQFRLQKVLDLKLSLENKKKDELAVLYNLLHEKKEEIRRKQIEVNLAYKSMKMELKGNVDVDRALLWVSYIDHLWNGIHILEDERRELNLKIDKCRKELLEIMKERKTLERLKEKQYGEYVTEADRQERLAVDEMATIRYVHQKMNGRKG